MKRFIIFLAACLWITTGVSAQENKEDASKEAEERHEEKLETAEDEFVPLSELKPLEIEKDGREKHSFQYGLSAANTFIVDTGVLPKGFFLGAYRPYLKYFLNEKHIFTARGKFAYKNNPSLTDSQKKTGLTPSVAEYNLELFNAELNFDRHQITAGRSFYKLGRGLLFANFADGAEYNGTFKHVLVKGQALYSGQYSGCTISIGGCATTGDVVVKSPFDIVPGRPADANLPDAGKRLFLSTEIQSPQLYGSTAYAVAMYSRDLNRELSTGATNKGNYYSFDPIYLGLGFSGFIITPRLRYVSEFIYETGSTYDKTNQRVGISAWGWTSDINYSLPWLENLLKPGVVFQYATGSGRNSAGTNPNNPSQESTGTDNNFYYFGVYSAGLALKPKLANLHIFRIGIQFRPLHHYYWGRNLMVAFKYTYYLKANSAYSISDNDAKLAKSIVGQGIDLQLVWDFRSDVKLFYAYGAFLPSEAYDAATAKTLQTHIVSLNFLF